MIKTQNTQVSTTHSTNGYDDTQILKVQLTKLNGKEIEYYLETSSACMMKTIIKDIDNIQSKTNIHTEDDLSETDNNIYKIQNWLRIVKIKMKNYHSYETCDPLSVQSVKLPLQFRCLWKLGLIKRDDGYSRDVHEFVDRAEKSLLSIYRDYIKSGKGQLREKKPIDKVENLLMIDTEPHTSGFSKKFRSIQNPGRYDVCIKLCVE